MMRILLAIVILATISSCNPDVDATFHSQIVVQGFLYANEPLDSIVVRRTLTLDTKNRDDRLTGATVTISTSDTSVQLIESTPPGRYVTSSPFTIHAGTTYQLLVARNGYTTAQATTTVPLPIHIDSAKLGNTPLADSIVFDVTLSSAPIHLWWSTSPGCAGYGLETLALDTTNYYPITYTGGTSLPDSNAFGRYRFFILSTDEQILWQQFRFYGPNVIRALALDQNYQDYILGLFLSGSQFNNSTLHVTGGLGVFASAARASKNVFLK